MTFLSTPHDSTSSSDMPDSASNYDFSTQFDYSGYDQPCSKREIIHFKKQLLPVVYSLICLLGLVGNILVVVTFTFYKRTKSMTDIYLLNMAIADILFVVTLPFWAVYHVDGWIFGDFLCKLVRSVYAINFNCSMLLLACISIDRYIAIVQATRSFRCRATTLTYRRAICAIVWITSILVSSVTYAFNQAYEHHLNGSVLVCEPRYSENLNARTWKSLSFSVQVFFGFFLPFLIMVFCYSFIVKTLLQAQNSQKHKAMRVVIAVVVVFLVCQIPYSIVILMRAVRLSENGTNTCGRVTQIQYAEIITETLAFLHCCLNPILYAFVGVTFRNYFLKMMQNVWCLSKKYITAKHSSRVSSDAYTSRKTSEVYDDKRMSSFTM